MTPWLEDADVTLYYGDVLVTLRELPAESVDCVVTSPPYWGLRDYGTALWDGGNTDCDHVQPVSYKASTLGASTGGRSEETHARSIGAQATPYRYICAKCGATRIDQQLGLESTPELFVERMVEVFREVRRVLAAHGTVWLNLGDSYARAGGDGDCGPNAQVGNTLTRGVQKRMMRLPPGAQEGLQPAAALGGSSFLKPKDLVGIPWRVAFALQADGWWLRSAITWCKPNAMPESVTDRPTKATEMVFLLAQAPRYYYDAEAIREKDSGLASGNGFDGRMGGARQTAVDGGHGSPERFVPGSGRNMRDWWEIPTQPFAAAHFATFPEELARRAILAGTPEQVCRVCGKARERVVSERPYPAELANAQKAHGGIGNNLGGQRHQDWLDANPRQVLGFTDCGHSDYRPGIVLDPFIGSGTVAHVARKLGRHAVGIDLNAEYLALAAKRLQQQSLFSQEGVI